MEPTAPGYGVIGFGGTTNGYNRIFARNGTADGLFLAAATGRKVFVRSNGVGSDHLALGRDDSYTTYSGVAFGSNLSNGYNRIFGRPDQSDGLYIASATNRDIYFRTNGGGANTFRMTAGGNFQLADVTVIDSSRNLTNILGLYGNGGTLNHYNTNHVFKSTTSNLQAHISDTGIGIGTSPSYKLHVTTNQTNVAVFDSSNDSGTYIWIRNSDAVTGRQANLGFAPANNIEGARISAVATEDFTTSANRTADLAFWTRLDGTMNERFRITSTGNVGVGTTAPASALSGSNTNLSIEDAQGSDIKLKRTGGVDLSVGVTSSNTAYLWSSGSYNILFGTAGTERMRLSSGGSVSIGTATTTGSGGLLVDNDIKTNSRIGVGSVGSTAAPAIYLNSDTDTGIYFPAANQLGLVAGGSRKFYINTSTAFFQNLSGGVLVNASSTDTSSSMGSQTPVFYASGYSSIGGLRINGADTGNTIYKSGSNLGIKVGSAHSIDFGIGGGTHFSITSSGNANIQNGKSLQISGTTVIDGSRNITSRSIVAEGNGTTSSTNALKVTKAGGESTFTVRDDGVVLVQSNYLYVNNNGGFYSLGAIGARGGITNDGGNNLSINSGGSAITFNSKNFTSVGTISSGQITSSGSVTAGSASSALGFYVGTTQVITGTRNLVSIGSISCSSVTSTDDLKADGGNLIMGDDAFSSTWFYLCRHENLSYERFKSDVWDYGYWHCGVMGLTLAPTADGRLHE